MAKRSKTPTNKRPANGRNAHGPGARSPQMTADDREKAGHGAKSAAVRERAVVALLSEKTVTEAEHRPGSSVVH